jgi:hypothetical protein
MQRLYETVFAVGLLVMPFCIGWAFMFCLGASPMSPALVVLSWVAVVGPLLVACLTLRCLSRWWALRWPQFINRSRYFWVHGTASLLFVGAMLYGFCWWPAAPLVHRDGTYVDKTGKLYTHAEFDAFERWESALNCVGLAFAISSVLGTPVPPWPTSRRTVSDQSAAATQR